ncbi:SH3 domain-containing protein [Phlyctema vagabunda]|uniref:SH3 domain-containing protein n=1 Tax=Phlyctema vagabunda TaxID=108571 RepID=A0ABR4PQB4_9HELO
MIKYFEEGESWGCALNAYKELQRQYEDNVFDYAKLARTQRAIATIYETIAKSEKLVPKYFRVIFRGMGFPPGLRDKEFIYQGSPTERTSAFADRMLEQHPAAQIVTSGDVDDVEGQFLQISSVTPHRDYDHHVFQRAKVPQVIRDYLLAAQPRSFSVTASRNTSGPVAEHHAEKIVYTSEVSFPTILQRSEIVSVERVKLSTLQTALERISRKTYEIAGVEKRVADGEEDMIPLLTEALNISVSPYSEPSVSRYRELLPSTIDNESLEEVELSHLESALKVALIDHALMIKRCLAMSSKSSSPLLRTSHEELSQNFEATFAPELASFAAPQPRDRTPTPTWALPSPEGMNGSHSLNGTPDLNESLVLDSQRPSRQDRGNRLSFLRRTQTDPIHQTNGHTPPDSGSERSRSKDNRRSFFGGPKLDEEDEASYEWLAETGATGRRSSSSNRPDTATTSNSAVGNVRKRLSMLKLGKKSSKASVLVSSVVEEE